MEYRSKDQGKTVKVHGILTTQNSYQEIDSLLAILQGTVLFQHLEVNLARPVSDF